MGCRADCAAYPAVGGGDVGAVGDDGAGGVPEGDVAYGYQDAPIEVLRMLVNAPRSVT